MQIPPGKHARKKRSVPYERRGLRMYVPGIMHVVCTTVYKPCGVPRDNLMYHAANYVTCHGAPCGTSHGVCHDIVRPTARPVGCAMGHAMGHVIMDGVLDGDTMGSPMGPPVGFSVTHTVVNRSAFHEFTHGLPQINGLSHEMCLCGLHHGTCLLYTSPSPRD